MPLDLLITGRIATLAGDEGFGWVEAIGITGGRIAFAGSAVDLESRADPHTRRIRLEPGEVALPGLTDAHLHLADAALAAEQVDFTEDPSLSEGLARIAAAHRSLPPDAWLEGAGWDQRRWGRWPTSADLEAAAPGRPVALWSFDHHALWVSPMALRIAGIDAQTPDPDGGIIRRAPDGGPEGVLLENACTLVSTRIPPADPEGLDRAVARLGRRLLELGVVGVHDPGHVSPDGELRAFASYGRLDDAGELPVRVHACLRSEALPSVLERGLRSGDPLGQDPRGRVRLGWLKLFADGTLGSRTAALLEPISSASGHGADEQGVYRMSPDVLATFAEQAAAGGIASQIHAIGDAAVRASLDALEPTVARVGLMPRLEHVQLVHPDDRPRFAQSGIAVSAQPVHLREDAATARRDWGDRAESWGYTWRTLLRSGAVLAFGTDAPVEPIDPWPGIAMAVLRADTGWPAGTPPFGLHEALTLSEALRAACVGPAVTSREPDRGRLVPGCRADLIVLPAAARRTPSDATMTETIGSIRPRLVLMDGEVEVEA